ncbi:MAG: DUF350 domain-containing protein [Bacteroidetes bacterium]|jgi:putative membrane protein|nr:MAG: DUF350 domain-containing protein [Bacteroidota bacterium]
MDNLINLKYVIAAFLYASLGIVILLGAYWVLEKITPENVWKQVVEHKNVAVAIVFAAFILGVAIIIASAIHG